MSGAFKKSLLICSGIAAVFALLPYFFYDRHSAANSGIWLLLFALIYLFFGLIFLIPSATRPVGQGMLLSGLLSLLIGFAVCSNASFSGMH